jgi:hypothetical protein
MSEDNWKLVYSSSDPIQVEIFKGVLEEEGIRAIIINKKDSAYLFGEAELYVNVDDVLKANQIIKKTE